MYCKTWGQTIVSCLKAVEGYRLGKIGHARWHITIDRICTVYMTTEQPDDVLTTLDNFGVKVHGKIMFMIKMNPSFADGPRLYWEIVNALNRTKQMMDSSFRMLLVKTCSKPFNKIHIGLTQAMLWLVWWPITTLKFEKKGSD